MKIKIIKLFLLTVSALLLNGCCKNCDLCGSCGFVEEANQELTNSVLDNLLIQGSIKKEGDPPTDNSGGLSFTIEGERAIGLYDEGFDFDTSSEKEIAGIYLRVKKNDAISDGYFKIEPSEPAAKIYVDTDFGKELGAGSNFGVATYNICYEVRVYDPQGNVSEPKDICFDLLGWGQDTSIARAWELQYYEEVENGAVLTRDIAEVQCGNGPETSCFSMDDKFFSFNDDGTFMLQTLTYKYENGHNDSEFDRYEEEIKGKWVYLENRLYLIVYQNTMLENETLTKDIDFEPGKAKIIEYQISTDDDFQPINMTLINDTSDYDRDGKESLVTEYFKIPRDE